jgi:hypothetical protein
MQILIILGFVTTGVISVIGTINLLKQIERINEENQ